MIAALFVQRDGIYWDLPDVDPWDEQRDARLYEGPHPVVAHPPCQRWCSFAKQIEKVHGYKVGDDGGCFEASLHAVRTYGGVLEHPANSLAWNHFNLPRPRTSGGWVMSFDDEGAACHVDQIRYGHPMRKATWLYAYGIDFPELRWGKAPDSVLQKYKWGSRLYQPEHDRNRPRVDKLHSVTPADFRDELIEMAASARVRA